MEENSRDLAVYILLRTDLPSMNPGKAAAQVHHAGVQMLNKYRSSQLVKDYVADGIAQGADNFNTTLVLGATMDDIIQRMQMAGAAGHVVYDAVSDPSYPFFVESKEIADLIPKADGIEVIKVMNDGKVLMVRPELTCAWFVGDRNDERFRLLFDGLKLHP